MKEAVNCRNIREIRAGIDEIDYQILAHLRKRMEYVEAIVKFKSDPDEIVARERQLELLQKRSKWAMEFGLDPELIEEIYKTLINWNVRKEMEIFRSKEKSNV
jgi:isochorismate pyruvate lyase